MKPVTAFKTLEHQKRYVDFLNKKQDRECALLLALGYSDRLIYRRTGLSTGQIQYRARKASLSRMDFRNGEGVFAETVLRQVRGVADAKLVNHLKREGVLYAHAA